MFFKNAYRSNPINKTPRLLQLQVISRPTGFLPMIPELAAFESVIIMSLFLVKETSIQIFHLKISGDSIHQKSSDLPISQNGGCN